VSQRGSLLVSFANKTIVESKRNRKKTTLKRSAKRPRLVCELSRSKSRLARSRNKKKRLGKRLRRRRPRRKRPNLPPNVPSSKPPGRENGNCSFSWKAWVTPPQMRMKVLNKPPLRRAPLRRASFSPTRFLLLRHQLRRQRPNHLSAAVMRPLPSPAHLRRSREIRTSRSFLSHPTAADQHFPRPLCHKLNHSHLHRKKRNRSLLHRHPQPIYPRRIRSTAWRSKKPPSR
jgi:hypothetical protein